MAEIATKQNFSPKMVKSFCAYMDVLGLKEKMKSAFEKKKKHEFFEEFYSAIKKAIRVSSGVYLQQFDPTHQENWKTFSDNWIFQLYSDQPNYEKSAFINVLQRVSLMQVQMAYKVPRVKILGVNFHGRLHQAA